MNAPNVTKEYMKKSVLTVEECYKIKIENVGSLNLYNSDVEELPDRIRTCKDMIISGSKIKKLPEHLEVERDLFMDYCDISTLPTDCVVKGNIFARHSSLTTIPDGVTIGGGLMITDSPVTSLPKDMTMVNGTLDMTSTHITELPENLRVWGSLIARNTPLKSLPKGLIVGGALDIRGTDITELPDDMLVGHSLMLDAANIKSVGRDIVVGGNMFIGSVYGGIDKFNTILIGGRVYLDTDNMLKAAIGRSMDIEPDPDELKRLNDTIKHLDYGHCIPSKWLYINRLIPINNVDWYTIGGSNYELFNGIFPNECVIYDCKTYKCCTDIWDGIRLLHNSDTNTSNDDSDITT